MIGYVTNDPIFLKRIITGDETVNYECDVEIVQQPANGAPKIA